MVVRRLLVLLARLVRVRLVVMVRVVVRVGLGQG
jgi:hypothetical protein